MSTHQLVHLGINHCAIWICEAECARRLHHSNREGCIISNGVQFRPHAHFPSLFTPVCFCFFGGFFSRHRTCQHHFGVISPSHHSTTNSADRLWFAEHAACCIHWKPASVREEQPIVTHQHPALSLSLFLPSLSISSVAGFFLFFLLFFFHVDARYQHARGTAPLLLTGSILFIWLQVESKNKLWSSHPGDPRHGEMLWVAETGW